VDTILIHEITPLANPAPCRRDANWYAALPAVLRWWMSSNLH